VLRRGEAAVDVGRARRDGVVEPVHVGDGNRRRRDRAVHAGLADAVDPHLAVRQLEREAVDVLSGEAERGRIDGDADPRPALRGKRAEAQRAGLVADLRGAVVRAFPARGGMPAEFDLGRRGAGGEQEVDEEALAR
jgi:hypothetical protein